MREASASFISEEQRRRGAKPRLKAVLYPFDLDYGLAPGAGEYVHTGYGGEPGKLVMAPGYFTQGSWTSPVMTVCSPCPDQAVPTWLDPEGYLDLAVYLRGGQTPEAVAASPYQALTSGVVSPLSPFYQLKVEFQESIRAWAVDSAPEADSFTAYGVDQSPDQGYESQAANEGLISGLGLAGRLSLPECEIIAAGNVRVDLAWDFSELRAGDLALLLDHRAGQWLNRPENIYLANAAWSRKVLELYQGWELADGEMAWQLMYQGLLQGITGMAHGWRQPHRVRLETRDYPAVLLQKVIGAPAAAGGRRPFMRGAYRARAELTETTPAQVSAAVKTGSGAAALKVLGPYRGGYVRDYLLEVEAGGEVGTATFRWSVNQGRSWQETGVTTGGADNLADLEEGLAVYWEAAAGTDLVAGDRFVFTATPPIYEYQVYGGPFAEITGVYLNQEETGDRVAAEAATGKIRVTGRSSQVEARVVKDRTTHPVDILEDILVEVGLGEQIHRDSFALAKSLTPEYAIGVCFENITAAQALREIVRRCLYDLWVDFGEIRIRAYLGED